MLENCLKNIIYCYYPKGINNITERERYLNSKEFTNLSDLLNSINVELISERLEMEIKKKPFLENIQNKSTLSFDRCLTFDLEIVKNNKLIRIVLEISVVYPYYYIYVTENQIQFNPYKWLTLPKRSLELEKEYFSTIKLLKSIIEKEIGYSVISENIKNIKINDLFFQDVEPGNFTVYNAFFKDDMI